MLYRIKEYIDTNIAQPLDVLKLCPDLRRVLGSELQTRVQIALYGLRDVNCDIIFLRSAHIQLTVFILNELSEVSHHSCCLFSLLFISKYPDQVGWS